MPDARSRVDTRVGEGGEGEPLPLFGGAGCTVSQGAGRLVRRGEGTAMHREDAWVGLRKEREDGCVNKDEGQRAKANSASPLSSSSPTPLV